MTFILLEMLSNNINDVTFIGRHVLFLHNFVNDIALKSVTWAKRE